MTPGAHMSVPLSGVPARRRPPPTPARRSRPPTRRRTRPWRRSPQPCRRRHAPGHALHASGHARAHRPDAGDEEVQPVHHPRLRRRVDRVPPLHAHRERQRQRGGGSAAGAAPPMPSSGAPTRRGARVGALRRQPRLECAAPRRISHSSATAAGAASRRPGRSGRWRWRWQRRPWGGAGGRGAWRRRWCASEPCGVRPWCATSVTTCVMPRHVQCSRSQ